MTMVVSFADGFTANTPPTLLGLGNETYPMLNDQAAFADLDGLDLNLYSSVFTSFEIERVSGAITYRQSGTIIFRKNPVTAAWELEAGGFLGDDLLQDDLTTDESIVLYVTDAGQAQYKTGDLTGHVSSKLKLNISRINS